MSINDPILIEYRKKQKDYIVTQGKETFYDDEDYLYTFEFYDDAVDWAVENLPTHLLDFTEKQGSLL